MSTSLKTVVALFAIGFLSPLSLGQETELQPSSTAEAIPADDANRPFQLGVTVTDSPGKGVLVKGVSWGGPAEHAGIRSGDFIMSVAGEPIQKPDDLQARVRSANAKNELELSIWRNGKTISRTVAFDPKFSDATREKAWLGVMLKMTRGGDVMIGDVMPASPAAEGGIRVGDTVLRINAENIDSVDELLALMKKIKAGDNVEVTVLRDGQERTFTVRIGSAVQRTMRWFEDHIPFEQLERRWNESVPEIEVDEYFDSFEGVIDRLRQEVNELRDEVHRLRKEDTDKVDRDAPAAEGDSAR